ncbi:cation:proton antiporter [Streptacidiphilus rugosus]|uniref:cation:proton antiporter n=1 Tax=Streptacidiphilus rugosus TaxID=405783 RepID=UPI00068EF7CD|nr:cation:proton antiporter [Streptacidiphilus rugosus]
MGTDGQITHLLAAAAVILCAAQVAGRLARRLHQPAVIGQLLAGLALGPTLLGRLPGGLTRLLLPPSVSAALSGLAQLALVVFLFAVGCELDLRVVRRRTRLVLNVAAAGFALPLAVGLALAIGFHREIAALGGPRSLQPGPVLFLGVALSITAVPVLTAVIRENRLQQTRVGVVSLAAAGLMDVLGWAVLTFALLTAAPQGPAWPLRLALLALLVLLLFALRPLLRRLLMGTAGDPALRLGLLLGHACAVAWATSALGLHSIVGALLAGVCLPRTTPEGTVPVVVVERLHGIGALLLPFFFVLSAQPVDISAIPPTGLLALLVVTVAGITVKVAAGALASHGSDLSGRERLTVGTLLSTRGLTELIALNAGAQAGFIGGALYGVLVLMALITTMATQPLLDVLLGKRLPAAEPVPRPVSDRASGGAAVG